MKMKLTVLVQLYQIVSPYLIEGFLISSITTLVLDVTVWHEECQETE
jgi:hypothetical protein